MSNITVLSGSMRKGGNTDLLVQAFEQGACGHNEVTVISVADYKINACTGCNYCYSNGKHLCCQKDDMMYVYEKLCESDVLVIATPVYFYGMSARLKAIIDRLHNPIRNEFKIKKTALLSVAADTLPQLFDSLLSQYMLTLDYFHLQNLGTVLVRGVEEKGAIKENPALKQAYELGLSIK